MENSYDDDSANKKVASTPRFDFIKVRSESGSEDIHYSRYHEGLPEEFRKFAEKELNETEENKRKCLRKVKEFMKKQDLTCSDDDILTVLRWAKYRVNKAESKLKKLLQLRKRIGLLLQSIDENKIKLILEHEIFGVLPYRDKHGRGILYTRANLHLDLYDMEDLEAVISAALLHFCSFPLSTVCGFTYIAECKSESLAIYYPILKHYRTLVNLILDAPLRLGRVDLVNENVLCSWFYRALRPILSTKITQRVFFNGKSYEALKKVYHPDILPKDFEGNLGPIGEDSSECRKELLQYMRKLKAEYSVN